MEGTNASDRIGKFCWWDLTTTSADGAKQFYGELLGWNAVDVPAGDAGTYTMLKIGDKDVAGLYEMPSEQLAQAGGVRWLPYVAVESADDIAAKAKDLNGTVLMDAMDVMDAGRMAMVMDPSGGTIGLWQAGKHVGAQALEGMGTVCWNELATHDTNAADTFYRGLFNWGKEVSDMGTGEYTMFKDGDTTTGGLFEIKPEMGPMPTQWMLYFAVEDCENSVAKAKDLGANELVPPTEIPNMGRFSILQDPQGAVFSVFQFTPPSA